MSTKIHVMRLGMMGSPENLVSCAESACEGWWQRWELGVWEVFLTRPHLEAE